MSEVKARALGVTLDNKSGFEALHRAICIPLDLEVPLGTHHLLARGKLDNLPSTIPLVGLKFLQAGLLPLTGFRISLGFLEGSGLSDGGEVCIGNGVERVIRVIRAIFLLTFLIIFLIFFIIFFITFWRVLIRQDRSGIPVLPDRWRGWSAGC